MGMIEDILNAYPDDAERERQEESGERSRELAPQRRPHSKRDFDRATRVKALQHRLAGHTYSQIADELKCSRSQARALIQHALRTAETDSVEEMRELENHRLDSMLKAIWGRVLAGELDAMDRALKLIQTRARLNGLEAPKKIDLAMSIRQEMEQSLSTLESLIIEGEVVKPSDVVDAEVEGDNAETE